MTIIYTVYFVVKTMKSTRMKVLLPRFKYFNPAGNKERQGASLTDSTYKYLNSHWLTRVQYMSYWTLNIALCAGK